MEAVRQVDSVTNTRDRTLQNRSSSNRKSSYHLIQKDSADLSPLAIALSRKGMDIKNSSVTEEDQNLSYDLNFKDVISKKLQSKGEVNKKNKEASAQLEFELTKQQNIDGIPHNKSLRFFLSYKFSKFQKAAENPGNDKNMALYLKELVSDIEEIVGKELVSEGTIVNQQDLKRIHNSEQEKISRKLIQIINISISFANMRLNLEEKGQNEIEHSTNQQKKTNKNAAVLEDFELQVINEKINSMSET